MATTLTSSSEMMTNYLPAELVSSTGRFEAVQTADGHGIVLSIGTNGALNAIVEGSGRSVAGWTTHDLSTATITSQGPADGTVHTFDVGQSSRDATIGLGMVVGDGTSQELYLSLGNSSSDLSWLSSPQWTAYPFDDPNVTLSRLDIVSIYFCEPQETQYIVVDILKNPTGPVQDVRRFIIDPSGTSSHHWLSQDLPMDVDAGSYDSVVGRIPNGLVDGVYTAGQAAGVGQLAYVPVANVYGEGPPEPTPLSLPAGVVPGAIASSRSADSSTDLFVVGGSTLYYWASSTQKPDATPTVLVSTDVLSGTSDLAAMEFEGVVTLWGRNGSDEVYSLSCPADALGEAGSWTVPLPLVTGAEHMSPYVNAADGGNTIYSAGTGTLQRITRGDANGVWNVDHITLPVAPTQPAISFNSYTTTLFVAGDDGLPAANATVGLTGSRRCAAYVNGLYYVVGTEPVQVTTTATGTLTIVEATGSLSGTTFSVAPAGGETSGVNPMSGPFHTLSALDTADKLTAARVTGDDGSSHPLVPSGTSGDTTAAVASGLGQLAQCYQGLSPAPSATHLQRLALVTTSPAAGSVEIGELGDIGDAIRVGIGDLFRWLETGAEAIIKVAKDLAQDVWHFVARIGDAVYDAILDTTDAIVGAAQWLFTMVKTAIEDVIAYVSFLFDWDDITRTKDVFHNLISAYAANQVNTLESLKTEVDNAIVGVEKTIATWANLTDWSGLGDVGTRNASGSASNPNQGQTAASSHLTHHFQNNASAITVTGTLPSPDLAETLVTDLFDALKNEAGVLDGVVDQLAQLAKDASSLTVVEILEKLAGILAVGVLGSAQVVVDAILEILIAVAEECLTVLDTTLHIPVISDILNAIGIPDISFLDLFCWIGATSYTVVYKIANDSAPFPEGDTTTFLSSAPWDDLVTAFASGARAVAATPGSPSSLSTSGTEPGTALSGSIIPALPSSVGEVVFRAGHMFGAFFSLISALLDSFEAAEETGENDWAIPSAVCGILGGISVGGTDVLIPRDSIENEVVSVVSTGTTVIRILAKTVFSGPLQTRFAASEGIMKNLAASDGRATGAIVDAILVVPALACSGWHFFELAEDPAGATRSDAILDEVSSLTSYVARVAYAIAVNDEDPESKAVEVAVMAAADIVTAGLQGAEAIVG